MMIVIADEKGNILPAWYRKDGIIITDEDNTNNIRFCIGVYYNDEQRKKYAQIKELKNYLASTDFRAMKYADGAYSEEEYAPWKKARAEARAKINEIEKDFDAPTLTREEIDAIEKIVVEKIKESEGGNADSQLTV